MTFETEQAIVDELVADDLKELQELLADESVHAYEFQHTSDPDEVKMYLESILKLYKDENYASTDLGIFEKESEKLIGLIRVRYNDPDLKLCDISGCLHSAYTNKGIATEVGKGLVSTLTAKGVAKVSANTISDNERACKLASRIGLDQEGHIRMAYWLDDQYHDQMYYGKVFQ